MDYPVLYRKRLIPEECIPLKDDIILYMDDEIIVTKWNTLKPRKDFHHGYSCYFLKEGYKVSKFLAEDDSLVYFYCDIVTYLWDRAQNTLTVVDLLADVIVKPDGKILMVRQYRNALERETLEVHAGKRDSVNEDTSICAARELEEETGYRAGKIESYCRLNQQ